jgi:lysyl-tRNA synthetase class I
MYTPTFFTAESFPNSHVEFNADGVILRISINIEKRMKPYLSRNNVFKAEKHWVYSLSKQIETPCYSSLKYTYNLLMTHAMINCRAAKQNVLQREINQLVINFNN